MKKLLRAVSSFLCMTMLISAFTFSYSPKSVAAQTTPTVTPIMGWSTWNEFNQNIDEQIIMDVAEKMVESGLVDAGYNYLNIDDNWQASSRDNNGKLQWDPIRFPSGAGLVDTIHAMGLKMGIYSSNGAYTCFDMPASQFNEEIDAKTFAEWGVDFLKYDYCHNKLLPAKAYGVRGLSVAKPYVTGTAVKSYTIDDAILSGSAAVKTDSSSRSYIDGLAENKGSVTFKVNVDEAGQYALAVDYYKTQFYGWGTDNIPMFVGVGDEELYIMMLPPSSGSGGTPLATGTITVNLEAGENEIKLYQPIRSANQKYDTAVYTYTYMKQCLERATKNVAASTGNAERPIAYEICEWGQNTPYLWAGNTSNHWRVTGDIKPTWEDIIGKYTSNSRHYQYGGKYGKQDGEKYGYNYPDMMEVGNGELTLDENIAHFSLWCQMASPLIIGANILTVDDEILDIFKNELAISVNQDARALQGMIYKDEGDLEYLVKPLENGKVSLVFLNRSDSEAVMSENISEIKDIVNTVDPVYAGYYDLEESDVYKLTDVWEKDENGDNVQTVCATVSETLPAHSVKMYIVEPADTDTYSETKATFDKDYIAEGESATLTVTVTNGGEKDIENAAVSLDLADGLSAKPISDTTKNNIKKGDTLVSKYIVTAGDVVTADTTKLVGCCEKDIAIGVNSTVLYSGSKEAQKQLKKVNLTVQDSPLTNKVTTGELTTSNCEYATTSWNEVKQNTSVDGSAMLLKDESLTKVTYTNGIGVNGNSEISYVVDGEPFTFTATVGVQANVNGYNKPHDGLKFYVYGDDTLLYDSGVMLRDQAAQNIKVSGHGYTRLRLVVDQIGTNSYDNANWANPSIIIHEPLTLTQGENALKIANACAAKSSYGTLADGKDVNGNALTQNGVDYSAEDGGFIAHAPAEIVYYINGASGVFTAQLDIDDTTNRLDAADVEYQIWGDDTLLATKYVKGTDDIQSISVDVAGYKYLRIVVFELISTFYDHAMVIQPRFTTSTEPLDALIAKAENALDSVSAGDTNGKTPQSVIDSVNTALEAVKAVDENIAVADVAAVAMNLSDAIETLEKSVVIIDKSELCETIIYAKSFDDGYMEDIKAEYDAAVSVYNDTEATADSVNNATDALKGAFSALATVKSVLGYKDTNLVDLDSETILDFVHLGYAGTADAADANAQYRKDIDKSDQILSGVTGDYAGTYNCTPLYNFTTATTGRVTNAESGFFIATQNKSMQYTVKATNEWKRLTMYASTWNSDAKIEVINAGGEVIDTQTITYANRNDGKNNRAKYTLDFKSDFEQNLTVKITLISATGNVAVTAYYITEPVISSIAVGSAPAKTEYYEGDKLSTTGMELEVTYDSGAVGTVTEGFEASADMSTAGQKTVTVTYGGKTTDYTVNVVHELETVAGKANTCTEGGYSEYLACQRCDHIENKTELSATGHTTAIIDGKEPTKDEAGWKDYYQCDVCDAYFEDADATKPIADIEAWKIGDGKLTFKVAVNEQTGEEYESFEDALAGAMSGQTVKLSADADVTNVVLLSGITLDLNGHNLTTGSFVGLKDSSVIDTSCVEDRVVNATYGINGATKTGGIYVDKDSIVLQNAVVRDEDAKKNTSYMPIYDGVNGCYKFVYTELRDNQVKVDKTNFTFMPIIGANAAERNGIQKDLLGTDNILSSDVKLGIKVTWVTDGYYATQEFVMKEEMARNFLNSFG